jgi:hypothetical protein
VIGRPLGSAGSIDGRGVDDRLGGDQPSDGCHHVWVVKRSEQVGSEQVGGLRAEVPC